MIRRTSTLYLLLAGAVSIASADNTNTHSNFKGVYLSGYKGPTMSLSLGADGSATVTEDPGSGARTLFGHWTDSLAAPLPSPSMPSRAGPAEPAMVFRPGRDGLQAVTWNHASWGKVDPPPMKKGYKVKQLYWSGTVP